MYINKLNKLLESILDVEKELTCYKNYDDGIYDTITYEKGQIILETEQGKEVLGDCDKSDFYMTALNILDERNILNQYEIIIDADDIVIYESGIRYY